MGRIAKQGHPRLSQDSAQDHGSARPGRHGLHHYLHSGHGVVRLFPGRKRHDPAHSGSAGRTGLAGHGAAALRASLAGDIRMSTLVIWSANFAIGCFMIGIVIATLRLVRGPDITDRVLALDTMYINGLMLLVALGVKFSVSVYFDIALLLALFGFVGSVAMAKFLLRGEVIER